MKYMGRRNKEGEFKSLVVRFHEDVKVYRKLGALLKISRGAAAVIKGYRGSLSTTNQSLNGFLSKKKKNTPRTVQHLNSLALKIKAIASYLAKEF